MSARLRPIRRCQMPATHFWGVCDLAGMVLKDSDGEAFTFKSAIEAQRFCEGYNRCLERMKEAAQ